MSQTDIISDALTMVRNASVIGKETVDISRSGVIKSVVEIFKKNDYIKNFRVIEAGKKDKLRIYLKYNVDKKPAIQGLRRISKPSLRVYVDKNKIPIVLRGYGMAILSTSKGILTDKEARDLKIGGEVICYVW